MKQDEFRQVLIDGTIHVIARDGIDKASAKQIEAETGINAVYIYRCFKDKEDMFAKTFDYLDDELASAMMTHVSAMYVRVNNLIDSIAMPTRTVLRCGWAEFM